MKIARRYPIGAEPLSGGRMHFRVWAPGRKRVEIAVESKSRTSLPMIADGDGYFSLLTDAVSPGTLYRYLLDGAGPFTDPASRFQPDGPHGPSQVVDPRAFEWTDRDWKGTSLPKQVLYEMHVGTFTPEGTWQAAEAQLAELAGLGITCLEIMPVNEFAGKFGWGYDGVNLFAPSHLYGTPDDFRRFVNRAHALGVGVILDVVYNHLGPDGNYLAHFSKDYFTDHHKTDWGKAINFDAVNSGPVREYFTANAGYWIDEFHLDGLRLDATQNIYDDAPPDRHILAEIGRAVRRTAGDRATILVNENECQHTELVRPLDRGGYGLDALWNDDLHHSAMVALSGRSEAYYHDYRGDPQEFISAAKYGYLYQGQWYAWQKQRRGHPGFDLPPAAFVTFLQNHDQVANSARGLRAHELGSPGRYRALYALSLLGPGTPMLFQGQEFSSSAPFFYFADHVPELAAMVEAGRKEFLVQFSSMHDGRMTAQIPAPHDPETFQRCKLNFEERETHADAYRLTRDLLKLRKVDPAFAAQLPRGVDGAVLGPQVFVLRFFLPDGQDRLLVVNLGRDWDGSICPEPLLAPPLNCRWQVAMSTESPDYGGMGVTNPETPDSGWYIGGESACVLVPAPRGKEKQDAK